MWLPLFELDLSRCSEGRLFPDFLEEDPWVCFHGTSGQCGSSIETDGFDSQAHPVQRSVVEAIVRVYESMTWGGNDTGGFGVLKSFSTDDFGSNLLSPTFFADRGVRALLFGSRDFSGGEKMRAVRRSIDDLKRYLNDSKLRTEHNAQQMRRINKQHALIACGASIPVDRWTPVDLLWLQTQLKSFDEIYSISCGFFDQHEYGVVYAVRFEDVDVPYVSINGSGAMMVNAHLPRTRIIGKIMVPRDYVHTPCNTDVDLMMRRRSAGLFASVQKSRIEAAER